MRRILFGLMLVLYLGSTVASLTGCAYYNTFYNVKRKFAEAERDRRQAERQALTQAPVGTMPQPAPTVPAGRPAQTAGSEKYRKVIETSSKLLEYYPKSRWVDDALLVMGVSYYWLGDLPRAERKFTELLTLFPKSKHLTDAVIWKARTLADQKKPQDAEALLREHVGNVKAGSRKARILFLLGRMAYDDKRYAEAVENFSAAAAMKQPRADRLDGHYYAALSQSALGNYEQARGGFMEVARRSPDLRQAYDASIQWARTEQALGHADRANTILERLRDADRFFTFADDTELELARLKVETGQIDEGIEQYEKFLATRASGERRGLAFFRLALIHRDHRVDLPRSKALLDSVQRTGAAKAIADSAKAALEQISKGLLALDRIRLLQQNIEVLDSNAVADSLLIAHAPRSAMVIPAPDTLAPERVDTTRPALTTSVQLPSNAPLPSEHAVSPIETGSALPDSLPALADSGRVRADSMAVLSGDSSATHLPVVSALARVDTARGEVPPPRAASPAAVTEDTTVSAARTRQTQRISLRRDLQVAYLHVAEFYEYSLADNDSALHYYRLAAADSINAESYWRANLYLAKALTPPDGPPPAEALERYKAVADADSVPIEAANVARGALNLPLIEIPPRPEMLLLRRAEEAYLQNTLPPDSLLRLYSAVIAVDSTSPEAHIALYAKAMLFENSLKIPDSARITYERLLTLQPDSAQIAWIHIKLAPPDSTSIFNMSDAELSGARPAVETLLEQSPDAHGWPPPEESLRGRRYR